MSLSNSHTVRNSNLNACRSSSFLDGLGRFSKLLNHGTGSAHVAIVFVYKLMHFLLLVTYNGCICYMTAYPEASTSPAS